MNEKYQTYRTGIDEALDGYFSGFESLPQARLLESMRYSLMAGGKRLRGVLALEFCRAAGGDPGEAMPAALAVEMLHTYSLIHDDLPCMDDDDLRRGEPTNHKVYGEWLALLAGDALQAEAFYVILASELDAGAKLGCAELLASAAGADGICGGQYMDIAAEGGTLTEDELMDICSRKTASMIETACCMGARIGGADEKMLEAASMFGSAMGLAFQVRDDMLDEIGSEKELGKPIGSDSGGGKTTYMTLLGEERCRELISQLTSIAKNSLAAFENGDFLLELADYMAERTS